MEALAQQMADMQANINVLAERVQGLEGERVHRETFVGSNAATGRPVERPD